MVLYGLCATTNVEWFTFVLNARATNVPSGRGKRVLIPLRYVVAPCFQVAGNVVARRVASSLVRPTKVENVRVEACPEPLDVKR